MGGDPTGVIVAVPEGSLVVLIGISGSGKSTFAARHFRPSAVLSSDAMRAMVADDPDDQDATEAAFELLHTALALRLARGRTTVVDATSVEAWARARLLAAARRFGRPTTAIVLALPLETCLERNGLRLHPRPAPALRRQHRRLLASLAALEQEAFAQVCVLDSQGAVDRTEIRVVGVPAPG